MTFEELKESISNIGQLEKVEDIRNELLTLQNSVEADYTLLASVTAERDELKSNNESLRSANNKLWLQLGEPEVKDQEPDTEPKSLSYSDLFNDKGGLIL